jgi:hypothetical protein
VRKFTFAAAAAMAALALIPPTANAVDVCNEAENSWQGGYTVNGEPVDPNPPAFLRGSQMRVGNGKGKGLENAALHSPALRTCGPTEPSGGDTDPGPVDPGPGPVDPGPVEVY